jgi:tripartite-type tricarboxylate transporter receptor subunit TctC
MPQQSWQNNSYSLETSMNTSMPKQQVLKSGHWAPLLLGISLSLGAMAQSWPAKPIRVVVPFPAGGGTDLIAREVGNKVVTNTKWTFIYDNKPGSGGNIGVDAIAKATPDGLNLVIGQTSNLAINPTTPAKISHRLSTSAARRCFLWWQSIPLSKRLATC